MTVVDQLHIIGKLCFSQRLTPQPFPHALLGKRHIPGELHAERHVGAQGRFISVPEEFSLK